MQGDDVDLYQQIRGIPLSLGPMAHLGIIDAIKRTYRDLEGSYSSPLPRPQPVAPVTGPAQAGSPPDQQSPSDLSDEEIAASFDNPLERFAAFAVKYGGEPPEAVRAHFPLIDQLTLRSRG